ncbi:MAG: 16S rRNA (guanine(966)-N(2))-methyltransferase RsmD [Persicimonas sp.]
MRIIAGRAGGRRLASPESREIRPTPERVREAIFSILGNIQGAVVVDGFAGTGAMGCEALSRGAHTCYFVDSNPEALELVEENLERIDARDKGIVLEGNFDAQLLMIDEDPDLWFLDPPYGSDLAESALEAMRDARCVTDRSMVVLEQDEREEMPQIEGFEMEDERVYGRVRVLFLRRVVAD